MRLMKISAVLGGCWELLFVDINRLEINWKSGITLLLLQEEKVRVEVL